LSIIENELHKTYLSVYSNLIEKGFMKKRYSKVIELFEGESIQFK